MPELVKWFSDNRVPTLNSVGLFLTIVGVLLLFRYGIALQVDTGGYEFIYGDKKPEQDNIERRSKRWSALAIVCIVVGTICQIVANWV